MAHRTTTDHVNTRAKPTSGPPAFVNITARKVAAISVLLRQHRLVCARARAWPVIQVGRPCAHANIRQRVLLAHTIRRPLAWQSTPWLCLCSSPHRRTRTLGAGEASGSAPWHRWEAPV